MSPISPNVSSQQLNAHPTFTEFSQWVLDQRVQLEAADVTQAASHYAVSPEQVQALRDEVLSRSYSTAEQAGHASASQRAGGQTGQRPLGVAQVDGVGVNPHMFQGQEVGSASTAAVQEIVLAEHRGLTQDKAIEFKNTLTAPVTLRPNPELGAEPVTIAPGQSFTIPFSMIWSNPDDPEMRDLTLEGPYTAVQGMDSSITLDVEGEGLRQYLISADQEMADVDGDRAAIDLSDDFIYGVPCLTFGWTDSTKQTGIREVMLGQTKALAKDKTIEFRNTLDRPVTFRPNPELGAEPKTIAPGDSFSNTFTMIWTNPEDEDMKFFALEGPYTRVQGMDSLVELDVEGEGLRVYHITSDEEMADVDGDRATIDLSDEVVYGVPCLTFGW